MRARLLAVLLLPLGLAGCPGNSASVGPATYLPPSSERYTVDGVALGASIADVRSAFPKPAEELGPGSCGTCQDV